MDALTCHYIIYICGAGATEGGISQVFIDLMPGCSNILDICKTVRVDRGDVKKNFLERLRELNLPSGRLSAWTGRTLVW